MNNDKNTNKILGEILGKIGASQEDIKSAAGSGNLSGILDKASPADAAKIREILNDPQKTRKILSSPQARALLKLLGGE